MAFGFGRRADKSDRDDGSKTDMPQQQQVDANSSHHNRIDAQTHTQATHLRQHIRLDGDSHSSAPHPHRQERSATISTSHIQTHAPRRRGELAGSLLEATRSQPPHQVRPTRGMTTAASAFLDEQTQQHDQQLRRMRRDTTTASQYSTSAKSTTSSSADSADRVEAKVDILFKGHLMVKRGLLKGLEKRFYFLVRNSSELYCCKDETSFNLWYASGWSLNDGNAIAKGSGLTPLLVCSVLRADRAGDSGGSDRGIVLVAAASSAKSAAFKFYAESAERCERWIKAFHKVQTSKRSAADDDADPLAASGLLSPHSSTAASSSGGSSGHREPQHSASNNQGFVASPRHVLNHIRTRQASRSDASQGSSGSGNGVPRAYTGGQLRAKSREDAQSVMSSSSSSDHSEAQSTARSEQRAPGLFNTALSSQGSQGNVLLFVPAAGSTISVSDSKLALAKKQIQELLAQGAKRPMRGGMDAHSQHQHPNQNQSQSPWRYGPPEYVLADLEYMKHKLREHESTPLESYVEECCQTFLMEATHRAHYNDWSSVRQEYFYLQVNDGERIPGHSIQENDMFGLLFVHDFDVSCDVDIREGEEKDPRAILSEAFTEGFPMEVLEVYTQPPQCYFSWRHWGPFSGRYKGVKGDGSRVEIRGFGQMQIDSNRMLNLRLFFKTKDLFDALNKVVTTLGQQRAREAANQRSRAVSSAIPHFPAPTASVPTSSSSAAPTSSGSTAAAQPTAAPPKSKATLTADIMDELANFTIASKERSK